MSIRRKWVGNTTRPVLTEKEINLRHQNTIYLRSKRVDGIKHWLEMLLWCAFFMVLIFIKFFCGYIFVMKFINFIKNIESPKIDIIFYEIIKIFVYGIGSILVKDVAKKKIWNKI